MAKAKGIRYKDGKNHFISKERAIELGWANEDGTPTVAYEEELARRANGQTEVGETADDQAAGSPGVGSERPHHSGIPSPYDLERRSGYRVIWQVLAESHDKVVPWDVLQKEVNDRLATEEKSAEWYERNYASQTDENGDSKQYDAHANAIVINRAPYNKRIEELHQRVIIASEGAMLMTNVTGPRQPKRKRKAGNKTGNTELADR